jgi:hypothetical protein
MTPVFPLSSSSFGDYQRYLSALAGNTAYVPTGDQEILITETLTANQSSVTFSSLDTIASAFQNLQIRITGRSNRAADNSEFDLRFNSDTGTNYTWHYMRSTGSATESGGSSSIDSVRVYQSLTAASSTANSFGVTVIDILDPFETTKNTTIRAITGFQGSLNRVLMETGSWLNANAVTSISLTEYYGSNFISGSTFSLIGVK